MKIFNLSYPKTGTSSLEKSLTLLKYNVCDGGWRNSYTNMLWSLYGSHADDAVVYFAKHSGYDVFSDGPWCGIKMYEKLDNEFEDSKFILVKRDSEKWYDSFRRTVLLESDGVVDNALEIMYERGRYGFPSFIRRTFDTESVNDKEKIIKVYEDHGKSVAKYFADKPGQLLTLDIQNIDWDPICEFLGNKIPNNPFQESMWV